jgi:TFIIF-interacting CTD phosphatase-like protein
MLKIYRGTEEVGRIEKDKVITTNDQLQKIVSYIAVRSGYIKDGVHVELLREIHPGEADYLRALMEKLYAAGYRVKRSTE